MREVVKYVGDLQIELGVTLNVEVRGDATGGYQTAKCRWDLARAFYGWADGWPCCEIASMTSQQEGNVVGCVRRLCERGIVWQETLITLASHCNIVRSGQQDPTHWNSRMGR